MVKSPELMPIAKLIPTKEVASKISIWGGGDVGEYLTYILNDGQY